MDEDLGKVWSQAVRYQHGYCVGICDLDWFKQYNDRFGHLAGDEVLRRAAMAVRASLRQGDTVYRYGGEEFLVLLPELTVLDAEVVVERVRRAVEALQISDARGTGVVTISAGVAELEIGRDATLDAWLRRADGALYAAKASGRNRVVIA